MRTNVPPRGCRHSTSPAGTTFYKWPSPDSSSTPSESVALGARVGSGGEYASRTTGLEDLRASKWTECRRRPSSQMPKLDSDVRIHSKARSVATWCRGGAVASRPATTPASPGRPSTWQAVRTAYSSWSRRITRPWSALLCVHLAGAAHPSGRPHASRSTPDQGQSARAESPARHSSRSDSASARGFVCAVDR